jgi:hypothetical protein
LFRVVNRYVGNLPPMPGVFPDYPAPVIRNTETGTELTMMRWGMRPPPRIPGRTSRCLAEIFLWTVVIFVRRSIEPFDRTLPLRIRRAVK